MSYYLIEARDSVLFRDARPFTGNAAARTMEVPWPSSIAGLLRTQSALDNQGKWAGDPQQVRELSVKGPWIAELNDDGSIVEHYLPAPSDCLFFSIPENEQQLHRRQLVLGKAQGHKNARFISDLPQNDKGEFLRPVELFQTSAEHDGKPTRGPRWWKASELTKWLKHPTTDQDIERNDIGIQLPEAEERVHIAIDGNTGTVVDGALFMTRMQRFVLKNNHGAYRRFALVSWADPSYSNETHSQGRPQTGPVMLGGERRMSFANLQGDAQTPPIPLDLGDATTLRVVLLTPALFDEGWRPDKAQLGGGVLIGAAVNRLQPVSGWDYQARGPKPTRYMAPAGSVYWIQFEDKNQAHAWAKKQHFNTISTNDQDRKDGFGLAAIGRGE